MQHPINIKEYKNELRAKFKERRINMPAVQKQISDNRIANRLKLLSCYKNAQTVITYVSTNIEVDTIGIINSALSSGKRVAVPRCVPGTREMEFYYINSLDELSVGTFSVLEPNPETAEKVTDFKKSICIVPALAADRRGYRLGYGGGYYDRFLREYPCEKLLILYKNCLVDHIWHGRFDVAVDFIITEYFIANITGRFPKRVKVTQHNKAKVL